LQKLPHLKTLFLNGTATKLTQACLKDLHKLTGLERLQIWGGAHGKKGGFTDADLPYLKDLIRLRQLDLVGGNFTDKGLAQLPPLPGLKELFLFNTSITDTGLEQLQRLPGLESLSLYHSSLEGSSKITGAGLVHLEKLPHLQSLHLMEIPL